MKKKKLIKKLQRKIERLETFGTVESRVVALEKKSQCKIYSPRGAIKYTFPSFVIEARSEFDSLRRTIRELKDEISSLKK